MEIKGRIVTAKELFNKKKEFLRSKSLRLELRKKLAEWCVRWSILLYGSEISMIWKRERNRIDAFEM